MIKRRAAQLVTAAAIVVLAAAAAWLAFSPHGAGKPPAERGDVLFATNRHMVETGPPAGRFDGRRGALRHGRCTVGYRPIPLTGDVADSVDFFVPTEFRQVESVALLDRDAFVDAIAARGDGPVVLYVHGYAYGFARTCRVGAELQRMVGDDATVVMFSWPSDGNPADYVADRADVEWSVPALAGLIDELNREVGTDRLRLLAHSLGTRGVLFALDWLGNARPAGPVADQLVLLAPDFGAEAFRQRVDRVRGWADELVLYASANDTPLAVSEALHGQPRLGQAGEHLVVLDGMTTIDVTPVGRWHPSGHEYFFYHPIAAADLVEYLLHETPPARRERLRERTLDGRRYWVLVEPASSRSDQRSAAQRTRADQFQEPASGPISD
ncbi:MAG: alpha/beta hydrolase [Candidatus Wenzhouxiangella sp. M2_3B_020]